MIDLLFRIIDLDGNNELSRKEYNLVVARDIIGLKESDTKGIILEWYN